MGTLWTFMKITFHKNMKQAYATSSCVEDVKSPHDLGAGHGPVFWHVGQFSFTPSFIPKVTTPHGYHGQSTQPLSGIPLPHGVGPAGAGPGGLQIFRSLVAGILITKGCGHVFSKFHCFLRKA